MYTYEYQRTPQTHVAKIKKYNQWNNISDLHRNGKCIKSTQHISHWGKCKLKKAQWDDTTHLLECLELKRLTILTADRDVEQLELSCTAGDNCKRTWQLEKQFDGFKILKHNLPQDRATS